MTGLNRSLRILPAIHRALRRYLTPFYLFALGLALVFAFSSCSRRETETAQALTATVAFVSTATSSPTQQNTPEQPKATPTPLPAIPATPDERTPSALGVTSTELSGLEINLWHPWLGVQEQELQALVAEFNRTNRWKINVDAKGYQGFGRLDEAVEAALASNSLPDVIVDYGYQARHWDDSDAIVDLTPYINDPTWGFSSAEQADFYPSFWNEDVITSGSGDETRRLGVPYYRSAYGLFYNQSWAQELGYPDPPVTPEDFRTQACAAADLLSKQGDQSNPGIGGWLVTPQPGGLLGWIYAFGGQITNSDGSGYRFDTIQTKQALEYLKELSDHNCAWYSPQVDPKEEFANRQALFVLGSLFDIPVQRDAFKQIGNADNWAFIPFPSRNQLLVVTYGPSLMITHSTPAKQLAAWLLAEWLVYPPTQAKWVEALKTFPTRQNTVAYLQESASDDPQWSQALSLVPEAHSEPSLASWRILRWALQDAQAELFDPQFEADQIPSLLENLDDIAAQVISRGR